ncbi:UNVERIFIED_CONTAM: hypothetical protein FKN15_074700 [Acipenser sinensis]
MQYLKSKVLIQYLSVTLTEHDCYSDEGGQWRKRIPAPGSNADYGPCKTFPEAYRFTECSGYQCQGYLSGSAQTDCL